MRMLQCMPSSNPAKRVAVVGAGLAGAAAARRLKDAGHDLQVFDKARGPGGRLATRRAEWVDRQDAARMTRLDHGAPGFAVGDPRFASAVDEAIAAGWVAPWAPMLAPGSEPLPDAQAFHTVMPELPRWCRELLAEIPCRWSTPIDGLLRGGGYWRLRSRGNVLPGEFDQVLLAMPPVQAAPLLIPHAPGWARSAARVAMRPCWTLMGISEPTREPLAWDAARPPAGPLAWILRNEARPGRERRDDEIHWVAHARVEWSEQRVESHGKPVQDALEAALDEWLGEALRWKHASVHRWRYALPPLAPLPGAGLHWWDRVQRLGVCGDFLGGHGVESAWLSGFTLAEAVMASPAGARSRIARSGAGTSAEAA